MTIQEAISSARRLRSTEITNDEMIGWLSTHDQQLYNRVLRNYGEAQPEKLPYPDWLAGHTGLTRDDVELMLPDTYALTMYPLYLVMMIDLHHADYDRYNNDAILYNQYEVEMRKDYSRGRLWNPPRPDGWPEDAPWDGRIDVKF